MKKAFFSFILFICLNPLFSQQLSGTWGGIVYTQLDSYARNYYMFLEIKQIGKDIWAVYNITDTNSNNIIKCLNKVKAVLPKKPTSRFEFYKEGLIDYDKSAQLRNACEALTQIEMHYFEQDSTEYLTGIWYPGVNQMTIDRKSLLVLQRMSDKTLRNINDYFASLAMPRDISADEKSLIIPDKVSTGLPQEKKLIETLKNMLEKNITLNTGRKNPRPEPFY
jgi:hypothetical protein